jgi:hypothetical protein
LSADDPHADAVRLGLIAVTAGLIGEHGRRTGQTPDDAQIKRLAGVLETMLGFTDSFVVAGTRLQGMEPGTIPLDEDQIALQIVTAFAPIVNAVSIFSYGRNDTALAAEIGERLGARAEMLREKLRPGLTNEADGRMAELGLLRALCPLYTACHEAGIRALQSPDGTFPPGELPMTGVWEAFETRVAMLEVLGGASVPATAAASQPAAPAAPAPAAPPPPKPVQAALPLSQDEAAPAKPAGNPANPMSFFKPGAKKPATDTFPEEDSGESAEG